MERRSGLVRSRLTAQTRGGVRWCGEGELDREMLDNGGALQSIEAMCKDIDSGGKRQARARAVLGFFVV